MKRIAVTIMVISVWQAPSYADEPVGREMERDVVLRALVDELERSQPGLKLEDTHPPYFMEYALIDSSSASIIAELGAVTGKNTRRSRRLRTEVRVGSYELDNTNFRGGYEGGYFGGSFGGMFGGAPIPIEDDYNAIRQAIWWASDRQYKNVIEAFAKKKAFMEGKVIEDKPDDFSRESPAVHLEEPADLDIDVDRLEEMALGLSRLFRDYPEVKRSSTSIRAGRGNRYLVNTEGTRLRTLISRYALTVTATVQAEDGMELSDSVSVRVAELEQLPSLDELSERCRSMIQQLVAVKDAPKLETYTGPVLFEAQAAASVFSRQLARRFAGGQRSVGSRTPPTDFANKLNKRILPRFIDVVDDPTRQMINGVPVSGHYSYDDQGVPARPVSLVEAGRLKALLMSRNPSREFRQSTGHGRGAYGPRAMAGCLIVTADPAVDTDTLKEELLEACQDEDLEYGIRIASLASSAPRRSYWPYGREYSDYGSSRGSDPLVMYKLYPDGREEQVRGAEIADIDLKAFKHILAAGDKTYVLNTGRQEGHTVVVPALLFEELDLAKIDRDFDKPPILPNPLARSPGEEE